MKKYTWGIIGLGGIAAQFAADFDPQLGHLHGAASRTIDKANTFAKTYQLPHAYGSYQELFEDPAIDIVYIATPNNHHLENILGALTHGKHVLCEKAITLNGKELAQATSLAREKNLVLVEAMTIYTMPLYKELKQRINQNEFGSLKMIQTSFGSFKEADPENRFFNPTLAGGAMLDIGTYALSFVRYFLTSLPTIIQSTMVPFITGVDEQSIILLRNDANELATIALSFQAKMPKQGVLAFEKAYITITDFPRADSAVITYLDGKTEHLQIGQHASALNYEVAELTELINSKSTNHSLALTTDVMSLMDSIRDQW